MSSGAERDPRLVESVKSARNAVNIFWEYAKKEVGLNLNDPVILFIKNYMPPTH
jgi:hypothetical protein